MKYKVIKRDLFCKLLKQYKKKKIQITVSKQKKTPDTFIKKKNKILCDLRSSPFTH